MDDECRVARFRTSGAYLDGPDMTLDSVGLAPMPHRVTDSGRPCTTSAAATSFDVRQPRSIAAPTCCVLATRPVAPPTASTPVGDRDGSELTASQQLLTGGVWRDQCDNSWPRAATRPVRGVVRPPNAEWVGLGPISGAIVDIVVEFALDRFRGRKVWVESRLSGGEGLRVRGPREVAVVADPDVVLAGRRGLEASAWDNL